jgi:lipopolysaccharide export LptBFGC system permease protein LptF
VGIPFILSRERNIKASASMTVGMSLGVYVAALLSRQLGAAGLDPVLAAWLPVLIFGPVAVWMLDAVKT